LTNIEDVKYFLTQQTEVSMPHAKKKPLYCSFCRRDENTVEKLIGGPGVYICDRCVGACNAILAGKPAPSFAGWDSLSDDELVGTLRPAQAALSAVEDTLREHVQLLRKRGITWNRIGDALGVTRQAAWDRFSGED
jgi:hypothetical protein